VTGEPQLSRTAGAEPVVADTQTGLMWQGCPAGLSGPVCSTGDATPMVWEDAVSYCIDLVWNGLGDWYLPDRYELQSIVDYSVYDPAIDAAAFPATLGEEEEEEEEEEDFWTSSSYAHYASGAWIVRFSLGYVGNGGKGYSAHVRCVRRGP
jgi:hypothetical protein